MWYNFACITVVLDMAPISLASPAMACMQEVQNACFKIGVPLRTRHREVAPNQYEFAPLYGTATTQVDQNLVVMQMVEEIAAKHGLAALIHEKPFKVNACNFLVLPRQCVGECKHDITHHM